MLLTNLLRVTTKCRAYCDHSRLGIPSAAEPIMDTNTLVALVVIFIVLAVIAGKHVVAVCLLLTRGRGKDSSLQFARIEPRQERPLPWRTRWLLSQCLVACCPLLFRATPPVWCGVAALVLGERRRIQELESF